MPEPNDELPSEIEEACLQFDHSDLFRTLSRALLSVIAATEHEREMAAEKRILSECERRYARREESAPAPREG